MKPCFTSLWDNAGYNYDHYIIDNGSEDGTVVWLKENENNFKKIIYLPKNVGISKASNLALDTIGKGYDLIIKMDNDCEIVSDNILESIVKVYTETVTIKESIPSQDGITIMHKKEKEVGFILSPKITGIPFQPFRINQTKLNGWEIGLTTIVGGVFCIVPANIYLTYKYPENLPLSSGQDTHFCEWALEHRIKIGYIEELFINHYNP